MLRITLVGTEFFNEETETFETFDDTVLELEHSLLSLSKWESRFKKPFLSDAEKSKEEVLFYVECMVISSDFSPSMLSKFSSDDWNKINAYIESSESATTFGMMPETKGKGEVITSELIYYWMVAFQIPFETERWHLNRLFALVRICNLKNSKPKKMTRGELARKNRELNEARKAQLGSSG